MNLPDLLQRKLGCETESAQIVQQVISMKAILVLLTFFVALRASPSYSVNDLGTLGSTSAIGFKINNSGTVVGWAETVYVYPQAFQAVNGGALQPLASLAASDSYAEGINSAGL